MKNEEIGNALNALGFMSGFAITDETITLWELDTPQPNKQALTEAAALWEQTEVNKKAQAASDKSALLAKLGITEAEARLLMGGN